MGYSRVLGSSSRSARGTIKMPEDVVILGGARTPMAEYVGSLKDLSALELGGLAARGALERTGVKPEWVAHVVMGDAPREPGGAGGLAAGRGQARGLAAGGAPGHPVRALHGSNLRQAGPGEGDLPRGHGRLRGAQPA